MRSIFKENKFLNNRIDPTISIHEGINCSTLSNNLYVHLYDIGRREVFVFPFFLAVSKFTDKYLLVSSKDVYVYMHTKSYCFYHVKVTPS